MNLLTGIAIVLILAGYGYLIWQNWGSKRRPLSRYLIGVTIVWVAVLITIWLEGNPVSFKDLVLVCGGYSIGTLGMYIAVHIYRS